jgi:carboxyl-terminal processing protease
MMRKTSLILLSAATGAALTLFVTQPRAVFMGSSARAATSDTYRQLNLFGDVFERVRSDYVEKPDDSKLVESAISGMLAPRVSATCRCRPAVSSEDSASKSRWKTA